MRNRIGILVVFALAAAAGFAALRQNPKTAADRPGSTPRIEILNVSYDVSRELWKELNAAFVPEYLQATGTDVVVKQSHGGSGTQARAVVDGLEADVVTLNLWTDTDLLRKQGLIADGWEQRLPHRSLPYTSTIVFVVRRGNPRQIKDWPDLVQPGVANITPNPKTSGNGKLSFLAAWASVIHRGGTEQQAEIFVQELFRSIPVLDTGGRAATMTFSQKGIGDVHLTFENEAFLEVEESAGELEIVHPPLSILAEPHVAVVDRIVDRRRTRQVAEDYLKFLYTERAQEIIARHHLRPVDRKVPGLNAASLPQIELIPVTAIAADWDAAIQRFFAEGAVFDRIYSAGIPAQEAP